MDVTNDVLEWFKYEEEMSVKLTLPLPPSLNEMIDIAKERSRKYKGKWMKAARPVVYAERKEEYEVLCDVETRNAGIFPPREPMALWTLTSATFYVRNKRDPIELLGGLKWPVDWLVDRQFVADDSERELLAIPMPKQVVDRRNPRLEIEVNAA